MRQVWITKAGEPNVLQVRETPDPKPANGEIRIRVRASGVNFADIMARMGQYPDAPPIPCVVGYEVAGVVDAVGDGVGNFKEGDWVLSFTRFNGYSDVVCVPTHFAYPIPNGMPFEKAAAIPVIYATAWIMLMRNGNLQPDDTVLVHSAGGGVGLAALQICQWKGAKVIGTASASKHERLKEMGVAHCIDYNTQDFEQEVKLLTNGRGVDIALDAVGGNSFRKSYRSLAPLGKLMLFGGSSSATGTRRDLFSILKLLVTMPFFHPLPLLDKNRGVFGVNMGHLWEEMHRLHTDMEQVMALVEDGTFDPVVDKCFPLECAADAHQYIQDRKNFGKVLLTTGEGK